MAGASLSRVAATRRAAPTHRRRAYEPVATSSVMANRTRAAFEDTRAKWASRRFRLFFFAALGSVLGSIGQWSCGDDGPSRSQITLQNGASDPDAVVQSRSDGGLAEDLPPGTQVDAAACDDGTCPSGYLCCVPCCMAGGAPVCQKSVGGHCPLPDLEVSEAALATKMSLDTVQAGPCELEEKCVTGTGSRKVLRFDVRTPNTGAVDLVLGNPDAGREFEWAACHKHYHFKNFAQYSLLDDAGATVVLGRKQAFCARDSARVDKTAPYVAKYDCENQGIQKGWEDIYDPSLPCQYLDVTDIPKGTYWLDVVVNPNQVITELNYENNHARVKVDLP